MAIQQKPNFQIAWAETGNKVSVPEAKLRQGWVAEIPPAEVENFYQNKQDTAIQHIFQSGIPIWDNFTAYTANKSYVQGSNGAIYIAASDNTGQNPVSTTAWRLLIDNATQVVNQSRSINTGYGLQGGGNLTSDRTLSLAPSGVNPGVYGSSGSVSRVTVDSAGRITSAANQAIDFNAPFTVDRNYEYNGYQVFPGGLIHQWALIKVGDVSFDWTGNILWVKPFPTVCLNVQTTIRVDNVGLLGNMDSSSAVYNITNTGFSLTVQEWQQQPQDLSLFVFAIGY